MSHHVQLIFVSSLLSYLTYLVSPFEQCIIVEDFNFPDINLTGCSSLSNSFCEFVFDCKKNYNSACDASNPCQM